MTQLSLESISKRFGSNQIIDNVSLDINAGEFMVILGPSGCGKSTLLNLIAGLEEVDSGSIKLNGQQIEHRAPKHRDVAMVFQNYALYPHMTVFENIAFGLKMRKIPKKDIEARVNEVGETLSILHLLDRKPRQLSGGERQRVAMGRAIARLPQIYLLDEPLSNLDALLRSQIRTEIKKLHAQLGITMIFVTHDQVEAMTLADRIAIMNKGHIVQVGTPDEIYYRPQTHFVATFLGNPSMNIINAQIDRQSQSVYIGGSKLKISANNGSSVDSCLIGFRPENVKLGGTNSLAFDGVVDVVEPTGPDLYALIDCEEGFPVKGRFQNGEVETGKSVRFTVDSDNIHVFDAKTGARLDWS